MRVIAGRLKGRHLSAPSGIHVRPTADRVKEALFSILGSQVVGARVLDLYAGTGSLGIEALSRGAAAVTFVDHHSPTVQVLRANLRQCEMMAQAEVHRCPVEQFITRVRGTRLPYQVVLADPPYQQTAEVEVWGLHISDRLIAPNGVLALEHAQKASPPSSLGPLKLLRTYPYGDTALSIYRRPDEEGTA